jgi:hypothetical protein
MTHFVIWRGLRCWRAESAAIELCADGLTATGTQLGSDPVPYRLDYRLDASVGHVTRSIEIVAVGQGWRRELDLRRDGHGRWTCRVNGDGDRLPEPGGDAASFEGALDCDLGFSPLTNTMPIRRRGLDRRVDAQDFLMAWIAVPELRVFASAQRYEHVRPGVVRYVDRGSFAGFAAELELDADGLVIHYPELAERVSEDPFQTDTA